MAGEHITDLVVVGIIVLSGLFALARGLVKELLSIGSWAGAVMVTLWGFMPLRPIARRFITWELAADIVTGAVLFFGSLILFSILAHLVAKAVHGTAMGAVDRSLGFVFGLLRGLLIVIVLYMATSWAIGERDQPNWFRNARAVPIVASGARMVLALVPEDVRKLFPPIVRPERRAGPEPAGTVARQGYRPAERRDMQRLIESSQ